MRNRDRFHEPNAQASSVTGLTREAMEEKLARIWKVLRNFPEAWAAVAAEFRDETTKGDKKDEVG